MTDNIVSEPTPTPAKKKKFSTLEMVLGVILVALLLWCVTIQQGKPTPTLPKINNTTVTTKDKPILVPAFENNKGSFKGGYIKGDGTPSRPKKWKR